MSEAKTIVLDVKGMNCQGCVNAVTRIIKRNDPQAEVKIDLPGGRVEAQSVIAAEALAKAISAGGYEAQAKS
ncbi:MAG: heavy-metal-associated domain-containing protein [Alphaproteobacteria bacterium]|nr:heavy-metal-associated domain-containing protein [Alphaproteobacteria bacterium]